MATPPLYKDRSRDGNNLSDAIENPGAVDPSMAVPLRAHSIANLAELRRTIGSASGNAGPRACILAGQANPLDAGAGVFVWDPASTLADNARQTVSAFTVARVQGVPTGCWRRLTAISGNTGSTLGRAEVPILLQRATPSASNTPVTATWVAGTHKQIVVKFWGRTNGYLQAQVNGDTGLNYSDFSSVVNGAVAVDNAAKGTNGFARILVTATPNTKGVVRADFFPLTDGFERVGQAQSTTIDLLGTAATTFLRMSGFCWHNTASDVTSFTVFPLAGQTMTGVVEIWGIPA